MTSGSLFSQLTFLNALPLPTILIVWVLTGIFLFVAFYRFSVPTRISIRILLAFIRTVLLLIIFFMILDPFANQSGQRDWIGLLVDRSSSMAIEDMPSNQSRMETIKTYLTKDLQWNQIREEKIRREMSFANEVQDIEDIPKLEAKGSETRLLDAIKTVDERYKQDPDLLGWILLSDGNATDSQEDDKELFKRLHFPWVTVGVGGDKVIENLVLEAPEMKSEVFVGEVVKVSIPWKSNLDEERESTLRILNGKKIIEQAKIKVGQEIYETEVIFNEPGDQKLFIQVEPIEGEGNHLDNSLATWVHVKRREIRVYYIESFYKDKNLFKLALEEDQDFKVDFASSLIGFAREKKVPFVKDPHYGLPDTAAEIAEYDVVVLSDVKRNLLSDEQILGIKELVESKGGALIMIGGVDSFGDGGYVGTEIEKMLPVEISEQYKRDDFIAARGSVEKVFRAKISEEAISHPLIQLTSDAKENKRLWETMPLLGGYNYVGRLKPAATRVLEHPVDQSTFGPRVTLAVQNFGRGKVLAFTSDVTYNWGQWFQAWRDEKQGWVFATFWRNTLKWLTENRIRERKTPLKIEKHSSFIEEEDPITWSIELPVASSQGSLTTLDLEIARLDKQLRSKRFDEIGSQSSLKWEVSGFEAGDYVLKATFHQVGFLPTVVRKPFTVHESRKEARHLAYDPKVLQELSGHSGGLMLNFEEVDRIDEAIVQMEKTQLRRRSTPFWHQLWVYFLILALLGLDWFIRKKAALE